MSRIASLEHAAWGFVAVALLARAAVGLQFQALPAMAPEIGAALDLGLAELGALAGLYMLPGVPVALLAGALLGRVTVRAAVVAGLAAVVASGALAALAPDATSLAAARLLGGVGAIAVMTATLKGLLDRFEPARVPAANGVISAGQPIGMGVALLAAGLAGAALGWRGAMAATALVGLAGLVAALLAIPPRGAPAALQRAGRPTPREGAGMAFAGMVVALYVGSFYALLAFLPGHLVARGWSEASAALAMAALAWAPVAMGPIGGWLATRSGRPLALVAACYAIWGGAVLFGLSREPSAGALAVIAVVGPIPLGTALSLPARIVAPERRGLASGVVMASLFAGAAAMPALAGWAGERIGGVGGAAGAAAVAVALCGAAYFVALAPLAAFAVVARTTPAAGDGGRTARADGRADPDAIHRELSKIRIQ